MAQPELNNYHAIFKKRFLEILNVSFSLAIPDVSFSHMHYVEKKYNNLKYIMTFHKTNDKFDIETSFSVSDFVSKTNNGGNHAIVS